MAGGVACQVLDDAESAHDCRVTNGGEVLNQSFLARGVAGFCAYGGTGAKRMIQVARGRVDKRPKSIRACSLSPAIDSMVCLGFLGGKPAVAHLVVHGPQNRPAARLLMVCPLACVVAAAYIRSRRSANVGACACARGPSGRSIGGITAVLASRRARVCTAFAIQGPSSGRNGWRTQRRGSGRRPASP
jgi:hypothetical protein